MSEFLFPHSKVAPDALKFRLAATGAVGAVIFCLIAVILGLQTIGVLGSGTRVTVYLPTVGDTLGINSDVKYRGLRVGRVIDVDPGGGTGEPNADVIVEAEHARLIPATVKARVLPSTLFGNEFVELVTSDATTTAASPAAAAAPHLRDGQIVEADTSVTTIRLMETLESTQRLLASADPSHWSEALSQLAEALEGRGDDFATFLADSDSFLGRWAKQEPQILTDLRLLADNADLLADVEPKLVRAMRDTSPLARMLVNREGEIGELLQNGTAMLADEEYGAIAFVVNEGPKTSLLLAATAPTLEAFAERSPSFRRLLAKLPVVLFNGAAAIVDGRIQMEGVMAPQFVEPYGPEDCPVYRGLPGPNCRGGGDR